MCRSLISTIFRQAKVATGEIMVWIAIRFPSAALPQPDAPIPGIAAQLRRLSAGLSRGRLQVIAAGDAEHSRLL